MSAGEFARKIGASCLELELDQVETAEPEFGIWVVQRRRAGDPSEHELAAVISDEGDVAILAAALPAEEQLARALELWQMADPAA